MLEKNPSDKWPDQAGEDFLAGGPRDLDQAEALLEEALLAGAQEAEVYLKTSRTSGIFLQGGFATLAGGSERGVALRVFDDQGRWGHAHASWGEPSLNRRLIREALAVLENLSAELVPPLAPAPRPGSPFATIDGVIDSRVLDRSPAEKREVLEKALRETAHDTAHPLGISLRDGVSRVALVNSRGLKACFHRTLALLTLTLTQTSGPTLVAEQVGCGIEPGEIAEKAEEILRLRDPGEEKGIAPRAMLLKSSAAPVLMRWLERTLLSRQPAGAAGRMASEAIDLVDDPLLAGGIAGAPFDGEGFPSRRKTLLEAGIQVGSLQEDPTSGAGDGRRTVRPSYRDAPAPGGTNLFALAGRRPCAEMIGSMETGVVLAALDHEACESDLATEIQWRGIGWEVRDGRVSGDCGRYSFRTAPRTLLNSIVESSSGLRFSLHRSTALGCGDLLILPRA